MSVLIKNNAGAKLNAAINNSQASFDVESGGGAAFPDTSSGGYFYATITEFNNVEIVKVTSRSSDSFTVIRGQDGSSAQAFSNVARLEQRWNKAQVVETIQDHAMPKVYSIPLGVGIISVVFSTAKLDTNYSVSYGFECNDINPIFLQGIIQNKTVNGFDILMNAPTDSANYKLNYTVGNAI